MKKANKYRKSEENRNKQIIERAKTGKGECRLCRGVATIIHHIKYFPQITIPTCKQCHDKIHGTPLVQYIKYKKGDSRKFYKNKKEVVKRIENYLKRHPWGN